MRVHAVPWAGENEVSMENKSLVASVWKQKLLHLKPTSVNARVHLRLEKPGLNLDLQQMHFPLPCLHRQSSLTRQIFYNHWQESYNFFYCNTSQAGGWTWLPSGPCGDWWRWCPHQRGGNIKCERAKGEGRLDGDQGERTMSSGTERCAGWRPTGRPVVSEQAGVSFSVCVCVTVACSSVNTPKGLKPYLDPDVWTRTLNTLPRTN